MDDEQVAIMAAAKYYPYSSFRGMPSTDNLKMVANEIYGWLVEKRAGKDKAEAEILARQTEGDNQTCWCEEDDCPICLSRVARQSERA